METGEVACQWCTLIEIVSTLLKVLWLLLQFRTFSKEVPGVCAMMYLAEVKNRNGSSSYEFVFKSNNDFIDNFFKDHEGRIDASLYAAFLNGHQEAQRLKR